MRIISFEDRPGKEFIWVQGLLFEIQHHEENTYLMFRKTLYMAPQPTGEEYKKLNEERKKFWLKLLFSLTYYKTDNIEREKLLYENLKKLLKKKGIKFAGVIKCEKNEFLKTLSEEKERELKYIDHPQMEVVNLKKNKQRLKELNI